MISMTLVENLKITRLNTNRKSEKNKIVENILNEFLIKDLIGVILEYVSYNKSVKLVSKKKLNNMDQYKEIRVDKKYIYILDTDYYSSKISRFNLSNLIIENKLVNDVVKYNSNKMSRWVSMEFLKGHMFATSGYDLYIYEFPNLKHLNTLKNTYLLIYITANDNNVFLLDSRNNIYITLCENMNFRMKKILTNDDRIMCICADNNILYAVAENDKLIKIYDIHKNELIDKIKNINIGFLFKHDICLAGDYIYSRWNDKVEIINRHNKEIEVIYNFKNLSGFYVCENYLYVIIDDFLFVYENIDFD
jgi:hypothetical protein